MEGAHRSVKQTHRHTMATAIPHRVYTGVIPVGLVLLTVSFFISCNPSEETGTPGATSAAADAAFEVLGGTWMQFSRDGLRFRTFSEDGFLYILDVPSRDGDFSISSRDGDLSMMRGLYRLSGPDSLILQTYGPNDYGGAVTVGFAVSDTSLRLVWPSDEPMVLERPPGMILESFEAMWPDYLHLLLQTELRNGIQEGDAAFVRRALEGGADPNFAEEPFKRLPLLEASTVSLTNNGYHDQYAAIVTALLEHGADPNLMDPSLKGSLLGYLVGEYTLGLPLRRGANYDVAQQKMDIIKALVEHGAAFHPDDPIKEMRSSLDRKHRGREQLSWWSDNRPFFQYYSTLLKDMPMREASVSAARRNADG